MDNRRSQARKRNDELGSRGDNNEREIPAPIRLRLGQARVGLLKHFSGCYEWHGKEPSFVFDKRIITHENPEEKGKGRESRLRCINYKRERYGTSGPLRRYFT